MATLSGQARPGFPISGNGTAIPTPFGRRLAAVFELLPTTTPSWSTAWWQDLVSVVFGAWLAVGLFVDGWAHNALRGLETFFTPWHALLYSGFLACALWYLGLTVRARVALRMPSMGAIPVGYGWGVAGVFIFGLGGLGDMTWHLFFGIEQGIDALFSPTHLLLAIGLITVLAAPMRAAWRGPSPRAGHTIRSFLPVILSMTLTLAVIAFFFMYLWTPLRPYHIVKSIYFSRFANGGDVRASYITSGVTGMLVMTAVMVGGVLWLLPRWRPPFGTVTVLFGLVATLMSGIGAFEQAYLIWPQALAGLCGDIAIRHLDPSPVRPVMFRVFAASLALVLWIGVLGTDAVYRGLGWSPEVIGGSVVWATLTALGMAMLMTTGTDSGAVDPSTLPSPVATGEG
ncbi:MAG: hypothetical protein EXR45_07080 [Chloroflexi bacterium]|nr:hypothetical protein [Chloroflexota bacterium]